MTVNPPRRRSVFVLCAMLLPALLAAGCSNGARKPDNGATDSDGAEAPADPREALRVADEGQAQMIVDLLDACERGDVRRLTALFSDHARAEAERLYGSLEGYAAASVAALERMEPEPARIDYPWQRPDDAGTFHEAILLRRGGETDHLAFYFERAADGRLRIDNILSDRPLRLPQFAPALGIVVPNPGMAFWHYFDGAILRRHNSDIDAPEATDAERRAYLRNTCSPRFIATMLQLPEAGGRPGRPGSADVFLDAARTAMTEEFGIPEIRGGSQNSVVFTLPHRSNPRHSVTQELTTVRLHGQTRLDRQSTPEPPQEPAPGSGS